MFVKKNWEIEKQLRLIKKIIFTGMIIMSFFLGSMLFAVLKGNIYESIFWPQMTPFNLSFRVDGLSIIITVLIFVLWSAVFIYSIDYVKNSVIRYYSLLLLLLGSVQDTIFAVDLVNFYIFLEITTIVTYFLITHNKDAVALKAGYKYLIMLLGGAFLILLSILFAYRYMGNYKMSSIITCGYIIAPILFLIGCFIKAGAIPLHVWLPDAHPAAPSPISAFLSGIMIKIGAYGIIRVISPNINIEFPVTNTGNILSVIILVVGILSMFIGVFLALIQTDVKRLLAYHSISQMGYILLGIGLGTKLGLAGGLY
ncbi:MAG: complex I subunit 5 family protein, partial [Atribacterota bacterium]